VIIKEKDIKTLQDKVKSFNNLYPKKSSRGLVLEVENETDRKIKAEIGLGQNTLLTVRFFLEHKEINWRILFYPKRDENLNPIEGSYFFTVVTEGRFIPDEDFKEEEFQHFSDAENDVINKIIKTYEKFPA
tara:strand:- start:96 stop:488 length:393 start_codon:yes stop_codon:yes gene_type:complete